MPVYRAPCRFSKRIALLVSLSSAWLGLACSERHPTGDGGASVPPATATVPVPRGDDTQPLARLRRLEAQGLEAIRQRRHGEATRAAAAMGELRFRQPPNAARRDAAVAKILAEAGEIRDALHRFLFVELAPLPADQRKALLAAGDRGDADAIESAAKALAEHFARTGTPHLRSTPTLRGNRPDPVTGLAVRYAGKDKSPWKQRFDEVFNARMRALVAAAGKGQ